MRNCLLALMAIALPTCAFAQVKGSINGTVIDSSQSSIAGATLVLSSKDTGEVRQVTSSEQGYFNFVDLARGDYTLVVKANGFRELQMGPLELTVGEQMTVRPKLEVGTLSEVVEVQATAPPVTTSTSSVSQLVDTKRIEQLPLNGETHCS